MLFRSGEGIVRIYDWLDLVRDMVVLHIILNNSDHNNFVINVKLRRDLEWWMWSNLR